MMALGQLILGFPSPPPASLQKGIWDTDGGGSLACGPIAQGWALQSSRWFRSSLVSTGCLCPGLTWLQAWNLVRCGPGGPRRSEARRGLALCGQVLLTVFTLQRPDEACAGWPVMEPTPSLTSNQESAGPAVELGSSEAPLSPKSRGVCAVPLGSVNGPLSPYIIYLLGSWPRASENW